MSRRLHSQAPRQCGRSLRLVVRRVKQETEGIQLIRNILIVALLLLILLGASMAFDSRFVPLSMLRNKPLFTIVIYFPTALFGVLASIQLIKHRVWPAAAFTTGLICTGLFHQLVADESHGNPGYMVATGHLAAPVVSTIAYAASFFIIWIIVKFTHRSLKSTHRKELEGTRGNTGNNSPG